MGDPRHERSDIWKEQAVIWHVGLMTVFTAWAFGGQAPWVRDALRVLGTAGIVLWLAGAGTLARRHGSRWAAVRWLWPLFIYDAFVIASTFNPSFRVTEFGGETYYVVQDPPHAWLPSSALPKAALLELWLLNGLVVSAHNLLLVSSRRRLRSLLLLLAANAVVLAVFGTFQKLLQAPGLWFGLVQSPNEFFFATFIYHNHWGAFALLNTAVCTGLLFHHFRRPEYRDAWHSPVLAGAVAALLLAATAPLSGSRSSSVLLCLFLLGTGAHFALRVTRNRRERHESPVPPLAALAVAVALGAAAVFWLARPVIEQRLRDTSRQVAEIKSQAGSPTDVNARLALYRDTWRMAQDKPWFGWGLESYGHVFQIYNSQRPVERIFRQRFYVDAHNDWLQSLAESGFVGTGLLLLLGLLPLSAVPWRRSGAPLPRYLLAGCALVLLYAWVEFPFSNPSVILAFWTALYAAVRHTQLDAARHADE